MTRYHVTSLNGHSYGYFMAISEADALDAFSRKWRHTDYASSCKAIGPSLMECLYGGGMVATPSDAGHDRP